MGLPKMLNCSLQEVCLHLSEKIQLHTRKGVLQIEEISSCLLDSFLAVSKIIEVLRLTKYVTGLASVSSRMQKTRETGQMVVFTSITLRSAAAASLELAVIAPHDKLNKLWCSCLCSGS